VQLSRLVHRRLHAFLQVTEAIMNGISPLQAQQLQKDVQHYISNAADKSELWSCKQNVINIIY